MNYNYCCQMCTRTIKRRKNAVELKFFNSTAVVCSKCYKLICNFFYVIFGGWE